MAGPVQARELVQRISLSHGHLRPEVLNRLSEADRREVEEALMVKDKLIGSNVITLAQNLYTSSARFVFELLQNADDNHFQNARHHGEDPRVSFDIFPDRIVMECNEDGFNSANLTAICNIGKSSKIGAQGYIGEKGIGFKSVFMAAYKVLIQSGHFSFYFQHRKHDSGMGMISPFWHDNDEYLGNRLTRITFFLHEDGDVDELRRQRGIIHQQFEEIHHEVLMFMKNIQNIRISFHEQNHRSNNPKTIMYSKTSQTGEPTALTRSISQNGEQEDDVRYYHITEHVATNLRSNENRTYSKEEWEQKTYSSSKVVLAFPLTEYSVPSLEKQCIFAFLPIKQMGFTFLIQADFVTQANRQDIVTTSARNEGLLDGIADAFIKAVSQFCEHDTLQYQWMRYLPDASGFAWDRFWLKLLRKITARVTSTPVLRSASCKPLRLINDLRRHRKSHLDHFGNPIFRDNGCGYYIHRGYQSADLQLLTSYGLNYMTDYDIICRASVDTFLKDSRLKSSNNESWHSCAAALLHSISQSGSLEDKKKLRQLRLLPLRDGRWDSASSSTVYFPKVCNTDLDIPLDLDFRVVHPVAVANSHRKKLFDSIGVVSTSITQIRDAIFDKHSQDSNKITIPIAISHLKFLYLSDHLDKDSERRNEVIEIYHQLGDRSDNSADKLLCFRDDVPYGVTGLLRTAELREDVEDILYKLEICIINDAYFVDVPAPPTIDAPSWKDWICSNFHVRRHPPLFQEDTTVLSYLADYIIEHRPGKVAGFLQTAWGRERPKREEDLASYIDELSTIEVLCRSDNMEKRPLKDTYLPIEALETMCRRYLLDGEFFPWLQLEDSPHFDRFPSQWEALGKDFGLGINGSDLKFALDMLEYIFEANRDATHLESPERIYELYIHIQAKFRESHDLETTGKNICDLFTPEPSIYIPDYAGDGALWALPGDCVWEAPILMTTKYSLAAIYSRTFPKFEENRSQLSSFFSRSLGIPDCSWEDLVEEIRDFKSSENTDFDRISELYTCLNDFELDDESADALREIFNSEALICDSERRAFVWYNSTECLWSSATQIRGMLILNELYSDLEEFFVGSLGVEKMTAELVYTKLSGPDASKLPPEEAKETLLVFSSFLSQNGQRFKPKPVLQSTVFPVRYPNNEVKLQNSSRDFALLDRKAFGDDFSGVAKFLDMSMEEIRDFQPFIRWAGFEGRYLSAAVKEISSADPNLTRPISSANRDIKRKAYALSRIAVTYKSPRVIRGNLAEFYTLLKSSETLETEKITAELRLNQDGESLTVEKETATLHIDESSSVLKFYVPRNQRSQDVCFNSKLPTRLCEWMMTAPTTGIRDHVPVEAIGAVQSVLNVGNSALSEILDERGILQIDIADDLGSEYEEFDETEGEEDIQEPEEYQVNRTSGVSGIPVALTHMAQPVTQIQGRSGSDSTSPVEHTPPSSVSLRDDSPSVIDEDGIFLTAQSRNASSEPRLYRTVIAEEAVSSYTALLRKTVDIARLAEFPSHGVFDMSALRFALTEGDFEDAAMVGNYRLHSNSQLERDMKIGAAGELYVFEMLSHLNPDLPNFSRENWKSNMRKYVTSHPDYSTMRPWEGREIADIMYNDTSGVFTNLLISKGYLSHAIWGGATPQYFIEVKTTTAACETPFYMSKAQYQKMQIQSNNMESRQTNGLYVIFRVFDIGKDSMGLKILVDPESMRQREELAFTAETWSVVTGR